MPSVLRPAPRSPYPTVARPTPCSRPRCRPAAHWASSPPMPRRWPAPGRRKRCAPATSMPCTGPTTRATLACRPCRTPRPLRPARAAWACTPCCPTPPGWAAWRAPGCPRCNCASSQTTLPPLPTRCAPPCRPCRAQARCCSSTTIGTRPWLPEPMVHTWARKTWMHSPRPNYSNCAPAACAWA